MKESAHNLSMHVLSIYVCLFLRRVGHANEKKAVCKEALRGFTIIRRAPSADRRRTQEKTHRGGLKLEPRLPAELSIRMRLEARAWPPASETRSVTKTAAVSSAPSPTSDQIAEETGACTAQ